MRSSEAMERKDLESCSALSRIGSIVAVAMDHSLSSLLQEKEPISAEIAKVDGLEASGSHTDHTTIGPHEIDQC